MKTVDELMALADRYAFHIPGSQHSDEARAALLAALQEQAREGEAVAIKDAVGCVLEGWTLPEPVRKILETAYYAAPQPAQPSEPAHPEQGELTGCACRWDADDNRVATCVRHQGWLDVVHEWAERAKSAETTLQSAQPVALPLTDEQINLMVHSQHFDPSYKLKASDMVCVNWYKLGLRDGERAHGIGGAL